MQKKIKKLNTKKVQWKDSLKKVYTYNTEDPADWIAVSNYNLNDLWLATSPDKDLNSFVEFYWPDKYVSTRELLRNEFELDLHCYESIKDFKF